MRREELLTMSISIKEINRCGIIKQTCAREIKQNKAAKLLGLTVRQIKRLCRAYRAEGEKGLLSKKRGKPSHRRMSEPVREQIKNLARTKYAGFGPTLMAEKLREREQIKIGKEALRQLLMQAGLWQTKPLRRQVIHQQRSRRACRGELVQIDGSPHDWFEGRAAKCCLIVFIDDATSEILYLRFEEAETTQAYFRGLLFVIETYGLPVSLYSDKHGIFRVNQGNNDQAQTQFGRACDELRIELINAHSAQAKGRVERANQTLQDRLVKELRLANISDRQAANEFLNAFRLLYNQRFAKVPREHSSAFMPNTFTREALWAIFTEQAKRKASKHLEFSFENKIYQIESASVGRRLQRAYITIYRTLSDEIYLEYQGKKLSYRVLERKEKRPLIVDEKNLTALCDKKIKTRGQVKPASSHPWRHMPISKNSMMNYKLKAT